MLPDCTRKKKVLFLTKVTEKKKKKHKKFKKKRRKKSREFVESVESFASSEEESESNWSLICSTEEDWEHLILKYKNSDKRDVCGKAKGRKEKDAKTVE